MRLETLVAETRKKLRNLTATEKKLHFHIFRHPKLISFHGGRHFIHWRPLFPIIPSPFQLTFPNIFTWYRVNAWAEG